MQTSCKVCNCADLYRGRLCRSCYNEKERIRRAEARKESKELERARARERDRERYRTDPEFRNRKLAARRDRDRKKAEGKLAKRQLEFLNELYGGLCAYCLKPSECLDHVVPLAHGGSHDITNVVPACNDCNLSKGSKMLIAWGGS